MTRKQELVLHELQQHATAILSFGDALDGKLNLLMGLNSSALGIFIILGAAAQAPIFYWFGLIVIGLIYAGGVIRITRAFLPYDYEFPLLPEWEHLQTAYLNNEEEALLDILISQYLAVIEHDNTILERKSKAVEWGTVALFVTLLILSLLQLIHCFYLY